MIFSCFAVYVLANNTGVVPYFESCMATIYTTFCKALLYSCTNLFAVEQIVSLLVRWSVAYGATKQNAYKACKMAIQVFQ